MPSGSVHDEQRDCFGTHAFPDFNQVLVHGFNVDGRQDQRGAGAAGRADGTEQIRPVEAPVAQRARAGAAPGPDAGQRALLANPCLVLEPDFNRLASRMPALVLPWLSPRSFFKSFLGCWIGLGVLRANRETAEVESPKQLAHASFVQGDAKLGRDAITQIGAAEPHNAVAGEIGALLDPRGELALFDPTQAGRPTAARPVGKPLKTCLVIAMNPVTQALK